MHRPSPYPRLLLALLLAMLSNTAAHAGESTGFRYDQIPESAYAVVAEVRAKPGKEAQLRAITLTLVARVRAEPNNILYFLHEDRESPGHFVFYEIFATKADFDAHNGTAHVQQWFKQLPELAQDGVHVTKMQILGNRN
jgi:quinol monooxygenase YgiN